MKFWVRRYETACRPPPTVDFQPKLRSRRSARCPETCCAARMRATALFEGGIHSGRCGSEHGGAHATAVPARPQNPVAVRSLCGTQGLRGTRGRMHRRWRNPVASADCRLGRDTVPDRWRGPVARPGQRGAGVGTLDRGRAAAPVFDAGARGGPATGRSAKSLARPGRSV